MLISLDGDRAQQTQTQTFDYQLFNKFIAHNSTMKSTKTTTIFLLCCFVGSISLQSQAQTRLNLYRNNQTVTVADLEQVQKITFDNGNLVIHHTDQQQDSFPLNEIQSIRFVQEPAKVEQRTTQRLVLYPNPVVNELKLANLPAGNSVVRIYGVSGILLRQRTLPEGSNSINVSDLPAGFYLLSVNGQTLRFSKQTK